MKHEVMLVRDERYDYRFTIKKRIILGPKAIHMEFRKIGETRWDRDEVHQFLGCCMGKEYEEGIYLRGMKRKIAKDLIFDFRAGSRLVLYDRKTGNVTISSVIEWSMEAVGESEGAFEERKKLEPAGVPTFEYKF